MLLLLLLPAPGVYIFAWYISLYAAAVLLRGPELPISSRRVFQACALASVPGRPGGILSNSSGVIGPAFKFNSGGCCGGALLGG